MNRLARRVWTLVILGLVATAGIATLAGQSDRASGDDMKALVAEVRALRLTIERTAAHTSQAQVLLGRVQLQENRLATLGRQYQDAHQRSLDAQMGQAEQEQRLYQMAERMRSATDPEERRAIEVQIGALKHEVARQQARTAELRSDATAAGNALTTEQQRWSAFNERLETLERTLSTPGLAPR